MLLVTQIPPRKHTEMRTPYFPLGPQFYEFRENWQKKPLLIGLQCLRRKRTQSYPLPGLGDEEVRTRVAVGCLLSHGSLETVPSPVRADPCA